MLDALALLFSCGGCIFVALRAVRLDREMPWFGEEFVRPRYRAPAGLGRAAR
jgi:hypothetical protein